MALDDLYDPQIAYNPDTEQLVTGAVFQVFAPDDASFTTPLTLTDPASGTGIATLRSSNIGVLPAFKVAGNLPRVIIRSGSFTTLLSSRFGELIDAGFDPAAVAAAAAAVTGAEAAKGEAELARDQALDAKADVEAVVATNDGIMKTVAEDPESEFSRVLSDTYVSVFTGLFDGSDETAAFQAACTAAAGGQIIIPRGRTLKTGRITVPSAGLSVRLERGAVIDFIDPGVNNVTCLFRAEDCVFFEIEGGTVLASNATGRTSTHGLIRAKNMDWLRVQSIRFGKSSATAVHTWNVAAFSIDDVDIDGTFADGIHLSRGTRNGTVSRIRGKNTGDDLVAINSYTPTGSDTFGPCENITIRDVKGSNIGNGTTAGRGVAVNGGKDVTVTDITIDGVAQSAVIVSRDAAMFDPTNVVVDGVIAHNTGLNPPVGGSVGAVYVANLDIGAVKNVRGSDRRIGVASSASNVQIEDRPRFFVPTSRMVLATGSPAHNAQSTHRMPVWLFDASTDESVSVLIDASSEMPGWKTFRSEFVWANAAAGSGDVTWRLYAAHFAVGDVLAAAPQVAAVTVAAGAQDASITSVIGTGLTAPADGRLLALRFFRVASGASDTLPNDAALLGVVLTRMS